MDWIHANNQELSKWEDRTTLNSVTQSRTLGVAFEYVVELSNRLGTDAWITVPHLADDDFIRNLA
jgi:hypothetical protein